MTAMSDENNQLEFDFPEELPEERHWCWLCDEDVEEVVATSHGPACRRCFVIYGP